MRIAKKMILTTMNLPGQVTGWVFVLLALGLGLAFEFSYEQGPTAFWRQWVMRRFKRPLTVGNGTILAYYNQYRHAEVRRRQGEYFNASSPSRCHSRRARWPQVVGDPISCVVQRAYTGAGALFHGLATWQQKPGVHSGTRNRYPYVIKKPAHLQQQEPQLTRHPL